MRADINDTSDEADKVQLALLREAGPVRRVAMAMRMSQWARDMTLRALRDADPEASELELKLRRLEVEHGKALADAVRAWLAERA